MAVGYRGKRECEMTEELRGKEGRRFKVDDK